jgi:hypothetical protein
MWLGTLSAQNFSYGYLVEFTDKANSIYNTEKPLEFLSQRAIDRRQRQNIEITEQDFPANKTYIDSLLNFNAVLHVTSRWFNSAVFYTSKDSFAINAKTLPFVKEVTLVYRDSSFKNANKTNKWESLKGGDIYGSSYNQISMCNAHKLHEMGYRGNGLHIAVLDAGFWRVNEFVGFDSLFHNNQILSTWDFIAHNDSVFNDNSHGMSVLSTMGGNIPGELIGTAPEASYHLFRTENVDNEFPIEEENWIAGAEVADSAGADIITASLGYSTYDDVSMSHSYADMDGKTTRITKGAELAFSKGIFVVNSAGNEGNNDWYYITAPSDGENVLCIGAVNADQTITSFSSRGPSYDGRVKPDVVAKGGSTTLIKNDGSVGTGSGTSFSGPVMAGMVACFWQALPDYSNKQILDLVRSYGDRFSNPNNTFGYGVPDFGKSPFVINGINVTQKSDDELVKVYPNPFKDELSCHFYIKKAQEIEVVLYDLLGTKVYTDKKQVIPESYNLIELQGMEVLEQGYYFLTLYTNDGILSKKIIRF